MCPDCAIPCLTLRSSGRRSALLFPVCASAAPLNLIVRRPPMKDRLGAALIFLGSLRLLAYGAWALTLTHQMTQFIPSLAPEVDPTDFASHWIVAASCWIFAGLARLRFIITSAGR